MIRDEHGFTLVEMLIALLIFSIVALGAAAVMGAATAGGFLDAFPTSFTAARTAKDYTIASVYLQTLQEYVAERHEGGSSLALGCYVVTGTGGCTGKSPVLALPVDPKAPWFSVPSELKWKVIELWIERWGWDSSSSSYSPTNTATCSATPPDCLFLVQTSAKWEFKGERSLDVRRFLR